MAISMGPTDETAGGAPIADINTTPLVDVMLVLLIIFLITVPVVIQTVPLDLPKVSNLATTTKPENINLSVKSGPSGCEIYWVTEPIGTTAELRERGAKALLAAVERQEKEFGAIKELPEVHIRGDANTPFRCIGGVIFAMQYAGYQKIGFISEPPAGSIVER